MTPLERAARAIRPDLNWSSSLSDELKRDAYARARAVLEAIREPSEGMRLEACGIFPFDGSQPRIDHLIVDQSVEVYQRMIDAALAEGA